MTRALDFAGADIPDSMQGRSFRTICETNSEPDDWKQEAYYRYWMHMAHHDNPAHLGIRTKTHSLIFFYGCDYEGGNRTPPAWELYDLENDPSQNVNVYDDPDYAQVVRDASSLWPANGTACRRCAYGKATGRADQECKHYLAYSASYRPKDSMFGMSSLSGIVCRFEA